MLIYFFCSSLQLLTLTIQAISDDIFARDIWDKAWSCNHHITWSMATRSFWSPLEVSYRIINAWTYIYTIAYHGLYSWLRRCWWWDDKAQLYVSWWATQCHWSGLRKLRVAMVFCVISLSELCTGRFFSLREIFIHPNSARFASSSASTEDDEVIRQNSSMLRNGYNINSLLKHNLWSWANLQSDRANLSLSIFSSGSWWFAMIMKILQCDINARLRGRAVAEP